MTDFGAFEILPFEPEHQEGVEALAEEILCRELGAVTDLSQEDDLQDVARTYAPPDNRFLVAFSQGQLVGAAGIRRISDTDCELCRLYVSAEHRRQAIATLMFKDLLAFVQSRGYRRILYELRPPMHDDDAVEVYGRYGFVPDSENAPRPGKFLAIHL